MFLYIFTLLLAAHVESVQDHCVCLKASYNAICNQSVTTADVIRICKFVPQRVLTRTSSVNSEQQYTSPNGLNLTVNATPSARPVLATKPSHTTLHSKLQMTTPAFAQRTFSVTRKSALASTQKSQPSSTLITKITKLTTVRKVVPTTERMRVNAAAHQGDMRTKGRVAAQIGPTIPALRVNTTASPKDVRTNTQNRLTPQPRVANASSLDEISVPENATLSSNDSLFEPFQLRNMTFDNNSTWNMTSKTLFGENNSAYIISAVVIVIVLLSFALLITFMCYLTFRRVGSINWSPSRHHFLDHDVLDTSVPEQVLVPRTDNGATENDNLLLFDEPTSSTNNAIGSQSGKTAIPNGVTKMNDLNSTSLFQIMADSYKSSGNPFDVTPPVPTTAAATVSSPPNIFARKPAKENKFDQLLRNRMPRLREMMTSRLNGNGSPQLQAALIEQFSANP